MPFARYWSYVSFVFINVTYLRNEIVCADLVFSTLLASTARLLQVTVNESRHSEYRIKYLQQKPKLTIYRLHSIQQQFV